MADMRHAGGGPEAQDQPSGGARLHPTPEEARRAQAIAEQAAGGTAEDLHRGAREEAMRQIDMEEHADRLRGYSMSLHGAAARDTYMRANRLRYEVGGRLVQDPPKDQQVREFENAVGTNYDVWALHTAQPSAVMHNVAYGTGGMLMFKDMPLVDALCARLAGYCGEGGRSEGAAETLDRLLSEVRAARQGPSAPPPNAPVPPTEQRADASSAEGRRLANAMLGSASGMAQQSRAPGKVFSRETMLAVIEVERTKWFNDGTERGGVRYRAAVETLDDLQHIFENLE